MLSHLKDTKTGEEFQTLYDLSADKYIIAPDDRQPGIPAVFPALKRLVIKNSEIPAGENHTIIDFEGTGLLKFQASYVQEYASIICATVFSKEDNSIISLISAKTLQPLATGILRPHSNLDAHNMNPHSQSNCDFFTFYDSNLGQHRYFHLPDGEEIISTAEYQGWAPKVLNGYGLVLSNVSMYGVSLSDPWLYDVRNKKQLFAGAKRIGTTGDRLAILLPDGHFELQDLANYNINPALLDITQDKYFKSALSLTNVQDFSIRHNYINLNFNDQSAGFLQNDMVKLRIPRAKSIESILPTTPQIAHAIDHNDKHMILKGDKVLESNIDSVLKLRSNFLMATRGDELIYRSL